MRLNLAPIVEQGSRLLEAIDTKSWHHSVNAAHACLQAMPSPAWMEGAPGLAVYGIGEHDANDRLNTLRRNVLVRLLDFLDPNKTWEANDPWPEPIYLRKAVDRLAELVPQEVTA